MGKQRIIWRLSIALIILILVISNSPIIFANTTHENIIPSDNVPNVTINIEPFSTIYEGDIINCSITGNPTSIYWQINDGRYHDIFYNDDPIIFDPEPTPIGTDYVNLTVYAENDAGTGSDTVKVMVKRLYFGDIHWHSKLCDAAYSLDTLLKNAYKDNYLDFVAYSGHSEWLDGYMDYDFEKLYLIKNFILLKIYLQNWFHYTLYGYNDWALAKQKANKYYEDGRFSTLLGFEWTPSDYPLFHINFYYRDTYPDALEYSSSSLKNDPNLRPTFDDILQAMSDEWDKGHLNIGLETRDKIIRGVEIYSAWGNGIGKNFTPELPYNWPYDYKQLPLSEEAWVENALWEWSNDSKKGNKFVLMASSDTHFRRRPGTVDPVGISEGFFQKNPFNPSGITAAYAVHNNRSEIWDAMNDCDIYASQLLKIRANVRFDGQMSLGRWINCTSPLEIQITAQSTFPGEDSSGRSMKPFDYSKDELDHPIQNIWLIKNDREQGMPWCKVINHTSPNSDTAVVFFEDDDVQPNDFYWIAIRQKGEFLIAKYLPEFMLKKLGYFDQTRDEYMAYLGPVFIENVEEICDT
jgi:hypothetical protein